MTAALRRRTLGSITEPARQIDVIHETDVLVVGSGPAGLAAALAAVARPAALLAGAAAATTAAATAAPAAIAAPAVTLRLGRVRGPFG